MKRLTTLTFLMCALMIPNSFAQRSYVSPAYHEHDQQTLKDSIFEIHNLSYFLGDHPVHSGPRLSEESELLYYFVDEPVSLKDDRNETSANQDIFQVEFTPEGTWSEPKELSELNNRSHNGVHYVSDNNDRLILLGEYLENGASANGLSVSHFDEVHKIWSKPERVHVKKYKDSDVSSYMMTSDESVLLLALDGNGTYGEQDIFVSFRDGKKWSKPLNLGNVINTPKSEGTMFLSKDSKTLYFSSNGFENSLGGYDVYKSERLDDTWLNWSTPENLGVPFNSEHDDLYYSHSNKMKASLVARSFLDSNKVPHSDILMIREKPKKTSMLLVKTYDAKTLQPIHAEYQISDGIDVVHASDVVSSLELKMNDDFPEMVEVLVGNEGYISTKEVYSVGLDADVNVIEIYLQPKQQDNSWEIENVNFEFDSDKIIPSSYASLEQVRDVLLREKDLLRVEISGHTDVRGNNKYNLNLSQKRAEAIINYLVSEGVDSDKLVPVGYGEEVLINHCENAKDCTEEEHLENRRVEFKILEVQ